MTTAVIMTPKLFDIYYIPNNLRGSNSVSSSLDDIRAPLAATEHVLTIEELRQQLNTCFTCGVSWADAHVSLDCAECGGYSMERPCPLCDGACNQIWKRDLTSTHSFGKARWEGQCARQQASLNTTSQTQNTTTTTTSTVTNKVSSTHALAHELCTRLEKLQATS